METDNNATSYQHLKEIILNQILLQEEGNKLQAQSNALNKKILRRINTTHIVVSSVVIIGLMIVIFILRQPESKANMALEQMNNLNTRISLQREYIEMDRKALQDIREALDNKNDDTTKIK